VIGRGIAPALIPPERAKRLQKMVVLRAARRVAGRVATVASALTFTARPWLSARLSGHRLGGYGSVRSVCEGQEAMPGLRARHSQFLILLDRENHGPPISARLQAIDWEATDPSDRSVKDRRRCRAFSVTHPVRS
jgi:hypothetical protein